MNLCKGGCERVTARSCGFCPWCKPPDVTTPIPKPPPWRREVSVYDIDRHETEVLVLDDVDAFGKANRYEDHA